MSCSTCSRTTPCAAERQDARGGAPQIRAGGGSSRRADPRCTLHAPTPDPPLNRHTQGALSFFFLAAAPPRGAPDPRHGGLGLGLGDPVHAAALGTAHVPERRCPAAMCEIEGPTSRMTRALAATHVCSSTPASTLSIHRPQPRCSSNHSASPSPGHGGGGPVVHNVRSPSSGLTRFMLLYLSPALLFFSCLDWRRPPSQAGA